MGVTSKYLLDTHALLWALTEPDRLGPVAREVIESSASDLLVSAASAWEIATKHRLGKLPGAEALLLSYAQHLRRLGVHSLAVSDQHALVAGGLDWQHRDPFDRMLAAQSMLDGAVLISRNPVFAEPPGLRVLW